MTSGMPIARVLGLSGEFDAAVIEPPSSTIASDPVLDVVVTMADSRRVTYRIALSGVGNVVYAREHQPDKIPAFCPQLHVNADSTFCIGWSGVAELDVTDEESARQWWSRLHAFLRLQHRARRLRKWPGTEWAHGDAARYQYEAEHYANRLGGDFMRDLALQRLHVAWWNRLKNTHGPLLRVYRDGTLIYTVSDRFKRVLNGRQKCVCINGDIKRHRRLRSCSDHVDAAAGLAFALSNWSVAEDKFWATFQAKKCCGRMDGCRLQKI
jgi:hypothetical protein